MPNIARPPERMSSMIIFSATRSGSFHGRMTAAVPSFIRSWAITSLPDARNTTAAVPSQL